MKIVYDYEEMKTLIKDNLKSKGILPKNSDVTFNVAYRKKDGMPNHIVSVYIIEPPIKEPNIVPTNELFDSGEME